MDTYKQSVKEEREYLQQTLACLKGEIENETIALQKRRESLIASRQDMWENAVHFSEDFDRLTELNHYLNEEKIKTASYLSSAKRLEKLERMVDSPYFGKLDFVEEGVNDREQIYIGLSNLMDSNSHRLMVFDWRAPISGIFYRSELGKVRYDAPQGVITGDVLLKRQYKIQSSRLKYFFDCSIKINDDILQEALSRNASAKMKNIVETIQKEQDRIIRDTASDLLIMQGVAGSGKTSIALHRIAFLLYDGLKSNIDAKNFVIISPNAVFSKYISSVLPELGEDNVEQITFDDLNHQFLGDKVVVETRNEQLEFLITSQNTEQGNAKKDSIKFKGSRTFVAIMDRLLRYYEHKIIAFEDAYYNGVIIETRQQLKNLFLKNKSAPTAKRLEKIKKILWEKVHPLRKQRLERIKKIVENADGHDFEIKSFSRLLSIKETKVLTEKFRSFTEIDYLEVYKFLFNNPQLFLKIAQGLELPEDIRQLITNTRQNLERGFITFEDSAPLLYLKLKIEGNDLFSQKRQVFIDEAQDYYPIQYEVLKLLFTRAKYTVLGDSHQVIDQDAGETFYEMITDIFEKSKTLKVILNKSYRSSYEINQFAQKLPGKKQDHVSFERHESEPDILGKDNEEQVDRSIIADLNYFRDQGYASIAIICKTQLQAETAYSRLSKHTNVALLNPGNGEMQKGALILPAYMAKGLEFDVVIICGADRNNYSTDLDCRLLYIACTRALHRLVLYYTGEKSHLI